MISEHWSPAPPRDAPLRLPFVSQTFGVFDLNSAGGGLYGVVVVQGVTEIEVLPFF